MSEKLLAGLGAEMVMGDMFLDRECVGNHRNGQFVITPAGAAVLARVAEGKPAPKPRKAPKTSSPPTTQDDVHFEADTPDGVDFSDEA